MQPTISGATIQSFAAANQMDGNWNISPAGIGSNTASYAGLFFWLTDAWLIGSPLQEGCLLPSAAPYQFVVVGDWLLPWGNYAMQVV